MTEKIESLLKSSHIEDIKIGIQIMLAQYTPEQIYERYSGKGHLGDCKRKSDTFWVKISEDTLLDFVGRKMEAYTRRGTSDWEFFTNDIDDEEIKL